MTISLMLKRILNPACLRRGSLLYHRTSSAHSAVQHKYNGYTVKEAATIPELGLEATLLEHRATGAQHLHLGCQDANNFFGVAFRTPPPSSSGVCHILEHLALCGSRKFPCRDPFFNMLNRSLSTFMNAFTGSDQTLYVFSTQNPQDFRNLLSVYLDATFAPQLREEDFRQEGWRLEHEDPKDKNSPIIFKGVVFNEMKGVFSDPNQFYARHLYSQLFPATPYAWESGGDPLCIPDLTWEGLRDYHATHYHPTNTRFITYGNLPLESHLEQIESQVLQHFEGGTTSTQLPLAQRWSQPREATIHNRFDPMSAAPDKQTVVSNSYVLSQISDSHETFSLSILGSLLVDGPNAPFYRPLLDVGPDYSPCTGFDSSLKESVFSVGVREVAEKDVDRVKEVIEATLDAVIETGFPEEQIQGVLHRVELATKHRTANFGLNCAMGVSSVWNHDGDPVQAFRVNDHVRQFVRNMADNRHFLQDKVAHYLKNNPHRLTLIMKPVENFETQVQQKEDQLLSSRVACLSEEEKDDIFQKGLSLAEHQKNSDVSCLPTLRVQDVQPQLEKTLLQHTSMGGVPVQLCEQPTGGLVYFRALLDASCVSQEELMLLPLFSSILTQMGAGSLDFLQLDQEAQLRTGGLDATLHLSEDPADPGLFQQCLHLSSYCLERNVDAMFALWKDIFTKLRLEDGDRLSQLVRLGAAELAQSISGRGHQYAMRRACSALGECSHRREATFGLTQIEYMKKLAEMENHDETLEKFRNLAKVLLNKASLKCALNGTADSLKRGAEGLGAFLDSAPLQPQQKQQSPLHHPERIPAPRTHFVLPLSVNYIGKGVPTVPYCHPHYASLKVAAKLLSSKFLHSEIREKGGAYGGGASISKGGHFMFYSYRDPNVERTLSSFENGVRWLCESNDYSDRDIDEAKLGVFGEVDAPIPAGSQGDLEFREGVTHSMRQQTRERIFGCTMQDIREAALRYLRDPKLSGTALIGPENSLTGQGWTKVTNSL